VGGKHTSTSDPKLNGIQVQSSTLGLPYTIGWGTNRFKVNLIWYNGFKAIPHTTKQSAGKGLGGSSSNTTYTYTASIMMAIGEGPLNTIRTVYRDKSVLTSLAAAGLSLATGTPSQAVWGYLTSLYPAQARAYARIAYIYAQDYLLNDGATLPNHSFEGTWPTVLAGNLDADPRDVLVDFYTNSQYGLPGWGAGLLGNWSDYSLYCRANNLLVSPLLEAQVQASAFVKEIVDATNSGIFWSEGVLKIVPYGDRTATANGVTWTPNLTPVYDLTENDFDPNNDQPVQVEILDQSDAYNVVQVEFLDRTNQYNVAIAPAFDDANIDLYGVRKKDPVTWHAFCDAGIAQHAAQLLLQSTLYKRLRYTFVLPWSFILLEPMDLVSITTTTDELKLTRQLVRILEISEDGDDMLSIVAEHVDIGTAGAATYASHSGSGYAPNFDVAPGSVSPPALINAPTSLTKGDRQVWCAAGSTSPNWGGCDVYISVDNITYQRVGSIRGAARYGTLTAALPSAADPDVTNTLAVTLATSLGVLGNATAAEAAAGGSISLVGNELVTYETATLTGANTYGLTRLHRGFQGTGIASHAIGERFVRLDDAIFKFSYANLNVGSTIYVKMPSFNVFGRAIEDIATVTAYTVSLATQTALPDVPTGLALSQTWAGSNLSVMCSPAARADSYRFRFFLPDETTLKREIVSATPAATYTAGMAGADGPVRTYHLQVIASNAAGVSVASSWITVTNAAPAALASPSITGGAKDAVATCTDSTDTDLAGYVLFYSNVSGFDPAVSGGVVSSGISSINIFGLAAGTYYGKMAAYDGWSSKPTLLNLSTEISFTITTGGGSSPSGGGPSGGGYRGTPSVNPLP
jgi:hypothetical protein